MRRTFYVYGNYSCSSYAHWDSCANANLRPNIWWRFRRYWFRRYCIPQRRFFFTTVTPKSGEIIKKLYKFVQQHGECSIYVENILVDVAKKKQQQQLQPKRTSNSRNKISIRQRLNVNKLLQKMACNWILCSRYTSGVPIAAVRNLHGPIQAYTDILLYIFYT